MLLEEDGVPRSSCGGGLFRRGEAGMWKAGEITGDPLALLRVAIGVDDLRADGRHAPTQLVGPCNRRIARRLQAVLLIEERLELALEMVGRPLAG